MADIIDAVKPDEQALATINVIAKGIDPNANSEDRLKTADLVNRKSVSDQEGHVNTQTQWLPLLGAVVRGDVREAIKYFNGGPTRQEDAYHPTLGMFRREYNQNGPTGKIFTKEGLPLSANEVDKIDKSGGLISNTDRNALETGAYKAATENQKAFMTGLAKPIADQYAKSIETAQKGTVLRNALEERKRIVADKSMAPVLDYVSKLKPEERQKLLGFVSSQSTKAGGTTAENTAGQNVGSLVGQNIQNTVGIKAGLGNPEGGVGGIAGAIIPGGVGVNAGRSTGGMNQVTTGGTTGATTGTTASNAETIQRNMLSELSRVTQGAISTPQQFTDLQKLLQLTSVLSQAQATMDADPAAQAPGVRQLVPVDPLMNSRLDTVINDINFQRNNSLNVAWNAYLAKEMHTNIRNIEPEAINELRDKFQRTTTFKAINNTYDHEAERASGKKIEPQEGVVYINRNNKLQRWVNGQMEPVNAR